jgi:hypothetical protein
VRKLGLTRAETIDQGNGHIETRRIAVRTALPKRLGEAWPGLTAICRIERLRGTRTLCSRDVIYAITSPPAERQSAHTMLGLCRDHWQIENTLAHVRDVIFRKDHCRVRITAAPRVLSSTRDFVPATVRKLSHQPRAGREYFADNKAEAIQIVSGSG